MNHYIRMAPTSILNNPYYLDTLSWEDIEALMTRSRPTLPRSFVSKRGLINLSAVPESVFRIQFRFSKGHFATL